MFFQQAVSPIPLIVHETNDSDDEDDYQYDDSLNQNTNDMTVSLKDNHFVSPHLNDNFNLFNGAPYFSQQIESNFFKKIVMIVDEKKEFSSSDSEDSDESED